MGLPLRGDDSVTWRHTPLYWRKFFVFAPQGFEVLLLIFCNQKLFVFAPQGLLFRANGKVDGKGSPGGGTQPRKLGARFAGANLQSPSTGILPLPAPTGGEGRGGEDKIQRNPEVLQKRVRVLEMGTAAITRVYARGLFFKKRLDSTRAGRETRSFCIPMEPRSPAPASDEAVNSRETPPAPPP